MVPFWRVAGGRDGGGDGDGTDGQAIWHRGNAGSSASRRRLQQYEGIGPSDLYGICLRFRVGRGYPAGGDRRRYRADPAASHGDQVGRRVETGGGKTWGSDTDGVDAIREERIRSNCILKS